MVTPKLCSSAVSVLEQSSDDAVGAAEVLKSVSYGRETSGSADARERPSTLEFGFCSGSIPQLMTLMTRGKCLGSLKEEEALVGSDHGSAVLMSETTSENAPTESQEGGGADDAEESSTATDAREAHMTALNLAAPVEQVRSMGTVASRDKEVDTEAPAAPHRPPVGRVRFNLNSDNQTRMVTSGNSSDFSCEEDGNHDGHVHDGNHDGHVHIHIVRTDIFNLSSYDIATRPSEQKTFGQWLTDNNHVEDHMMFLLSLVFCGSMIMTLTFAWIEIDTALANISWPFAAPVVLLIAAQTCFWLLAAIYALWLYPKAYYRWKAEPPRHPSHHEGGRHRGRRRGRHRRHRRRHNDDGR